ncbi:MAG: N-acetylmuramoyl-L-alanine amidase [Chloroflexota bacterium]
MRESNGLYLIDARRVRLSRGMQHVADHAGAKVAINGSYFDGSGQACTLTGIQSQIATRDRGTRWPYLFIGADGHAEIRPGGEAYREPTGAFVLVLGGGPVYAGGQVTGDMSPLPPPGERRPRTAIGVVDGHPVLVVTRAPMTMPELGRALAAAGIDRALGLDGGSSTALWDGQRYLVGGDHPVANALVVEEELKEAPAPPDERPVVSSAAYWDPFAGLMRDKVIIIDPGHGGPDPGAVAANGLKEKDVNLQVALMTRDLLRPTGAKVVMTRETDAKVFKGTLPANATARQRSNAELGARVAVETALIKGLTIAEVRRRFLFLSVHHNWVETPTVGGTEVYSYTGGNAELAAKAVHRWLLALLGTADRYAVGPEAAAGEHNYYVVRETAGPAVLTEAAFLSNPGEAALLREPTFLQKEAFALSFGVADYFAELQRRAR